MSYSLNFSKQALKELGKINEPLNYKKPKQEQKELPLTEKIIAGNVLN